MLIYYLVIFGFVFFGLGYNKFNSQVKNLTILSSVVFLTLLFGLRNEVGVDWFNYIGIYENVIYLDFFSTFELSYRALNLFAYNNNFGIVFVVFVCTFIFSTFTLLAPKKLDINPYYFFAIVAPYHLVMSGVNYTRQGVSLSIFIFAISCLIRGEKWKYFWFIIFAGTFHVSALCFLPLVLIDSKKRFLVVLLVVILPPLILVMSNRYDEYLITSMDSAGLLLRALFLIIPAFLFLANISKVRRLNVLERRLIIITILSFPTVLLLSLLSTTMGDRISYYFILLSTYLWLYFYNNYSSKNVRSINVYGSLVLFLSSFSVFVTWCVYSKYIPYYEFKSYISIWFA